MRGGGGSMNVDYLSLNILKTVHCYIFIHDVWREKRVLLILSYLNKVSEWSITIDNFSKEAFFEKKINWMVRFYR